jgi:hypothetical protein
MADKRKTFPYGYRIPENDDACTDCARELRSVTTTMCYIVVEKVNQKVKHTEVHWCPRHQREVHPLRRARDPHSRNTVLELLNEKDVAILRPWM